MTRAWANSIVGFSRISDIFMVLFVTGLMSVLLGVVSGPRISLVVFLQPIMAVCFFTRIFRLVLNRAT